MKKTTLYRVKAERLCGDSKDEKRAKQLQTLADLGLQEFEDGAVLCTADQFIQLLQAGYCGSYIRPDEAVTVAASVDAGPDVEGLFRILADKIASMPSASNEVRVLAETLQRCKEVGNFTAECYRLDLERDEALLRQALDTLAYWLEHGETPGSHDMIQRTHDALQERLK